MDEMVQAAMLRWPNVPAVYGWLSLDARGDWFMLKSRVEHAGLIDFMSRNVGLDERGAPFVQNGPQRVFYQFETAPCVVRYVNGKWLPQPLLFDAKQPDYAFWVGDEGRLFLGFGNGLAAVDDRDFAALLPYLCDEHGELLDDEPQEGAQFCAPNVAPIPLIKIDEAELLARYGLTKTAQSQHVDDCVLP